ncbi:MAG: tRNA 2-thiouridine synthesizing protein C [Arenicella sp.]|jgi:tRNA 2-thiouridine synthesizing protein C
MSDEKILYVISRAAYSNASGQEALDAILIGASFDLDVSVLFIHDGVFQLKQGQQSSDKGLKLFTKTYKALADFGVEKIYIHDLSIASRGLTQSDLICTVTPLDSLAVGELIAQQAKVFTF